MRGPWDNYARRAGGYLEGKGNRNSDFRAYCRGGQAISVYWFIDVAAYVW